VVKLISIQHLALKLKKQTNISLTHIRGTLLPKLISGELRIPDAEKLAEAALA
jgi:type I restriction enzyme S subunit